MDMNFPAPAIAGDARIAPRGCKHIAAGCCSKNRNGALTGRQFPEGSVNLTIDEALALQTFPPETKVAGRKGKQFLQVGNAVPSLMAQRVLEAMWGMEHQEPVWAPVQSGEEDQAA